MSQELIAVIVTGVISVCTSILLFRMNRKANKEDSAIISQSVESIKSDFQKINDRNRAEIELLFQTKREMISEQRKVIIDFWEQHFHLMRLCDTTRYEIDEIRIQDFLKLKSQIESQQEKCEILYTRVYLFFDQPEFISLCDKINGLCSVNSIKFLGFMDRIEPLLNSASHALTIGDITTYQSINVTIDEKSEEIDEYLDRNDPAELLDKFKTISWTLLYR